ncbi:MAG: class IV adenylate cyclase [Ignavibacteriaceae bacterium]|nr:class IV adenylate cyclase [Ignavibacteriaceae bacterium]
MTLSELPHLNIEIKARTTEPDRIREILKTNNADFIGVDHQVDTYFKVASGRLKLREGNIENHLIYYERENTSGPKKSIVMLYKNNPDSNLKEILIKSLGVLTVVDKRREIYFIDNVKFHLDSVVGLGTFVEIEAIDKDGTIGNEKLLEQCNYYLNLLLISKEDLIATSYSDMLLH